MTRATHWKLIDIEKDLFSSHKFLLLTLGSYTREVFTKANQDDNYLVMFLLHVGFLFTQIYSGKDWERENIINFNVPLQIQYFKGRLLFYRVLVYSVFVRVCKVQIRPSRTASGSGPALQLPQTS